MRLRHLCALLALFAGLSTALLATPWRPIFNLEAFLHPWPKLPNYPSTLGLRKVEENSFQATWFLTYDNVTSVQDFYETALRNDGWSYQEYVMDNCSYVNRYFE